jgi:signal peptidase II
MISKNLNKNVFINLFIILLIFFADRLSKIYVIYLDKKIFGNEMFSSKYLNINLIWNEGIAFGLLAFNEKNLYDILTIIIFLILDHF